MQYQIKIIVPSIILTGFFKHDSIKIISEDKKIELFYNHLDLPVFFIEDKESGKIYIFYQLDIEYHVFFIIEENDVSCTGKYRLNYRLKNSLEFIIKSNDGFTIGSLTDLELNNIKNIIMGMDNIRYNNNSIPILDLGFIRFYVPKSKILEMLEGEVYRNTLERKYSLRQSLR